MEARIRKATEADLNAINDIYNYYVLNSTCTYQMTPETVEDRIKWFSAHGDKYPVIICEINNEIIGWASISPFHKREGYKFTVEDSVYIKNGNHGKGLGSRLLKEIIEMTQSIGYHSIIAGISSDQNVSIILHEKFGFKKVAHLKRVGFKFDKWLDVVYYQLLLV